MNDSVKRAGLVVRAHATLAKILLRQILADLTILAVALVFALSAIAVLNIAAYMALDARLGPVSAGLIVGAANALLAVLLMRRAHVGAGPSQDEKVAREICALANEGMQEDLGELRDEWREFVQDLRLLKKGVSVVLSGLSSPIQHLIDTILGLSSRSTKKEPGE